MSLRYAVKTLNTERTEHLRDLSVEVLEVRRSQRTSYCSPAHGRPNNKSSVSPPRAGRRPSGSPLAAMSRQSQKLEAGFHARPFRDVNPLHAARARRAKLVLHFHGLDYDKPLAGVHLLVF